MSKRKHQGDEDAFARPSKRLCTMQGFTSANDQDTTVMHERHYGNDLLELVDMHEKVCRTLGEKVDALYVEATSKYRNAMECLAFSRRTLEEYQAMVESVRYYRERTEQLSLLCQSPPAEVQQLDASLRYAGGLLAPEPQQDAHIILLGSLKLLAMADKPALDSIESACASAAGLLFTIQAVPGLEGSALDYQLRNTMLLCNTAQRYSGLLRLGSSDYSKRIVKIVKHLGDYSQDVKNEIELAWRADFHQWDALEIHGKDLPAVVNQFQMHTSSIFIGVVTEAMIQDLLKLSPNALEEFQEIVTDTEKALGADIKSSSEKMSQFLRRNFGLSATDDARDEEVIGTN
ncbi:hypothetical protein M409DRAFT_61557 [Zasmidium cellare ATCC 36951]|uniref:Uncharacterized protein n=1 Tax=Zasmidium cellare ATCC 36951 TaxID=1080233 RepID=A0A6A6BV24_ZASCE|nr:uncharacterized protein M409DRAFT_61557 [Zasmidium cellare ATCC 36951]KAF2158545.1 hypothetical protein M409DRAFT_61557 [Zasmidium cellare ATCC 36951]